MRNAANMSQQVRRYRTQRPRVAATFRKYLESASLSKFVDWPLFFYSSGLLTRIAAMGSVSLRERMKS